MWNGKQSVCVVIETVHLQTANYNHKHLSFPLEFCFHYISFT